MQPNFVYPAPVKSHLGHPHGVRVFQMIDKVFTGIADAAKPRGIRFVCHPLDANDPPTLVRNTGIVYRWLENNEMQQVPLLQCVIDLVRAQPARAAIRHPAHAQELSLVLDTLDQFSTAHKGSLYEGPNLRYDEVDHVMRSILKTAGYHCLGQICMWPMNVPGDDRDRDMAVINLVLKDEFTDEFGYLDVYDYQITLIWNGPGRFSRLKTR